jgi:hypothetical protein
MKCVSTRMLADPRITAAVQATRRQRSLTDWPRYGWRVRGGRPSMADHRGPRRACPCVAGCGTSTTCVARALHGLAARVRSSGATVVACAACAARRTMRVATRPRDAACSQCTPPPQNVRLITFGLINRS